MTPWEGEGSSTWGPRSATLFKIFLNVLTTNVPSGSLASKHIGNPHIVQLSSGTVESTS